MKIGYVYSFWTNEEDLKEDTLVQLTSYKKSEKNTKDKEPRFYVLFPTINYKITNLWYFQ